MIDAAVIEQRMQDANPIPTVADIDDDELTLAIAAAGTRRAAIMQAPTQHPTPVTPITPLPPKRRKVWAFAAAFIALLVAVGAAALVLRGGDTRVADEPAPTTILQEEPEAAISVDSLIWTRVSLGPQGPSLAITEGGPGLIGLGFISQPDPDDLEDGGGGPGSVQGYRETPTVWTSPDGYEWNRVSDPEVVATGSIKTGDIAAGDSGVVAIVEHHAWFSPDGVSWSRVPEGSFTENADWLTGVIAGGPGFVAFGEDELTRHAAVWTSPDGLAWTRVPDDPEAPVATIHAMTQGGPGLVAVGFDATTAGGAVWTSEDGSTWTRVPHDPAVFGEGDPEGVFKGIIIEDVAAGETGLVAVGFDLSEMHPPEFRSLAAVWTSLDGLTWARVPHDPESFEFAGMTGVAAVADGFVAIGWVEDRAQVWTSLDGTSWTRSTDISTTDTDEMRQVITAGTRVIILGGPVIWIGSPG